MKKHEIETSVVYLADCVSAMRNYPDKFFNLAVVDPPYGININMNMGLKKGQNKKHTKKNWDCAIPSEEYFNELMRVSKNQIIWGGNYFGLPATGAWIFWDKQVPKGVSFADGELAWTSFTQTLIKVTVPYSGIVGSDKDGRIHPTQKPIALYDWVFSKYAQKGDKIIDTHVGSGSSRISADRNGLEFTGFEIDEEYFALQNKRYENYKSQLTMF